WTFSTRFVCAGIDVHRDTLVVTVSRAVEHGHWHAEHSEGLAPLELRTAEWACLAEEQVRLPARALVDHVELPAAAKFFTSDIGIEIDVHARKVDQQAFEGLETRVYDEIDVLSCSG